MVKNVLQNYRAVAIAASFGLGTGLASPVSAEPAAAVSATETASVPEPYAFAIMRNGNKIGEHMIDFEATDDGLAVTVRIMIEVSFGPLTVYSYEHENMERWQDGRLVEIKTETLENGDEFDVNGRAVEDAFLVSGIDGEIETAPGIIPTSYWNKDIVMADTLLDSQRGTLIAIEDRTKTRDETLGADCYDLTGDLDITLCYETDRLRKLAFEFDGSYIEYQPLDQES